MIKVLVVDDETDVELMFRQQFRKQLKEDEMQMHFDFSGNDALNFLAKRNPFDIVMMFSDINMPGMTGLQLLKEVKQAHPDLKVIMLTAYNNSTYVSESKRLGAEGFLTKPVNFGELKQKYLQLS